MTYTFSAPSAPGASQRPDNAPASPTSPTGRTHCARAGSGTGGAGATPTAHARAADSGIRVATRPRGAALANQRGWGRGFPAALPGRRWAISGNKSRRAAVRCRLGVVSAPGGVRTVGAPGKDWDAARARWGLWASAHQVGTEAVCLPHGAAHPSSTPRPPSASRSPAPLPPPPKPAPTGSAPSSPGRGPPGPPFPGPASPASALRPRPPQPLPRGHLPGPALVLPASVLCPRSAPAPAPLRLPFLFFLSGRVSILRPSLRGKLRLDPSPSPGPARTHLEGVWGIVPFPAEPSFLTSSKSLPPAQITEDTFYLIFSCSTFPSYGKVFHFREASVIISQAFLQ